MAVNTPPMVSGSLPVFGHIFEMMRNRDGLLRRGYDEHGDIFAINFGNRKAVVLTGSKNNRLFFAETDKSLSLQLGNAFLVAALGENLFTVEHEDYMNRRPIIQEMFNRSRMARYVEGMNKEVQIWLDSLGESGEVDLTKEMLELTQYVAGRALVGDDFREELGEEFWTHFAAISKSIDPVLPPNLPLPKFINRDRARAKLFEIMKPVIERRRDNPERYDDLISAFYATPLKDGTHLGDKSIIEMFVSFLFAGHETTAGQAAWLLYDLLKYPEYLHHVQDEIDRNLVYGEPINGRQLRETPLIYYAIDEVTRMHPSAEMLMRVAVDDIEIDGYVIPKGWTVFLNAANTHFLPEVWSDADKFDPWRWSPERNEGSDPFIIMGFGGGMHKCTGMNFAKNEMAVIVGLFFQQFEVELISGNTYKVINNGTPYPSEVRVRYRRRSPQEIIERQSSALAQQ